MRTGEHCLFLPRFSQLTVPLWLFGLKTGENERLATRLVREGICVRPILAKNRTLPSGGSQNEPTPSGIDPHWGWVRYFTACISPCEGAALVGLAATVRAARG